MIYLLFISLLIMFYVSFIYNKKDVIAPAVVFCFGFLFQSIWAVAYAKKWDLGLHINTFLTIFLGVLEFIVTCIIIKKLYYKYKKNERRYSKIEKIEIESWKKKAFIIFSSFVILINLYFIIILVNGDITNIAESITKYNKALKFGESAFGKMPFIVNNLRIVVIYSGYWFLYVIINNYLCERIIKKDELVIIILCLIASIITGSRGDAFMILISGIVFFLIISNRKNKFKTIFDFKKIKMISIIGAVFLLTFLLFANLLGRKEKTNMIDYLSIYCGAEIKNLDFYLQEDKVDNNRIIGSQTFYSILYSYGNRFDSENIGKYKLDLPFREVNGYNLGNVYTTFYPYIYDFGYVGVFILIFIMAAISQLIYEKIFYLKIKVPSLVILVYGVIFSSLLFSFFSNKFYEYIFSIGFIKMIITWMICGYFFCRLKLDFNINKNHSVKKNI